jgi:quinol monooxygenase YgiN
MSECRADVSIFVAIHHEAWPDRLGEVLTTIGHRLVGPVLPHPGHRSVRLFQRNGRPTALLELSEWTGETAFEQFQQSRDFVATTATCRTPPMIERLDPIHRYMRIEQPVTIAACATITAAAVDAAAVEEYLLGEAHQAATAEAGLIYRELYRSRERASCLLLVHRWRSLTDLQRFRVKGGLQTEAELTRLRATVTRFTGILAREAPPHDS